MTSFKIGKKTIGNNSPVFIVAELSGNHNQNFDIAVKSIYAAKKSGADAIKLQTYTPDTLTIDSNNEYFKIKGGTLWDGKNLYSLYKDSYTPWRWHSKLKRVADEVGIILFSAAFDKTAVDLLEKIKVPAYKIASFEAVDIPLIKYAASKNKPIIISSGMSTLKNLEEAVEACKQVGNDEIAILKCTSVYPAPFDEINLKTIPHMKDLFQTVVGYSDHTLGIEASIAAATLGAEIVEKHFILDKTVGGPDAKFSLDPEELSLMVKSIRNVEKALGEVTYELSPKTQESKKFLRSLFVVEDIKKGQIFSEKNVRSIRPGYGLSPKYLEIVTGKKAKSNLKKGTPFTWDLL